MKKVGVTLVLFIILLLLLKNRIGDVRPALLPPATVGFKPAAVGESPSFPITLPEGFHIGVFARNLGSPRDIVFSEQGTLLASIPRSNKVVALSDKNNDGVADETKDVLTNLDNPHGLAFFKGKLYVVEETKVVRYQWNEETHTATKEKELFSLPAGGNHTSRTIAFNSKGDMFISIGSTCDVCYEKHEWLAAVVVSDEEGRNPRLFAKGLRNAVFITVHPQTNELWGTEMGRDHLGDNLPPDEINIIREGKDYGWPVCYGRRVYDIKFGASFNYCGATEVPIYEIAAHSAPLGLTFINSQQFPKEWQGDLLISYHGSWNRSTPTGFKVVRLKVEGDRISSEEDFLTGFLAASAKVASEAFGRPVDLAFDSQGSLYISDDKAGFIYKITYTK